MVRVLHVVMETAPSNDAMPPTLVPCAADIAAMAATVGTRPIPLLRREVGGLGEVVRARIVVPVR